MFNDLVRYHDKYRGPVIAALTASGYKIKLVGVLESKLRIPFMGVRVFLQKNDLVVSSNLKSNAFILLFSRSTKVVILNGFGRFRTKRKFRFILRKLLCLRGNTFAIVQNYADYRYLKRYCPSLKIEWVPGSGGTIKEKGDLKRFVIVQRDSKITSVAPSVRDFFSQLNGSASLVVVGCNNSDLLEQLFPNISYQSVGYVDGKDIFKSGSIFLQPTGYGEGFPHTLADAIVSDLEIYISNREFIRYGLWILGAKREYIAPGWSRIIWDSDLPRTLHTTGIVEKTLSVFNNHFPSHSSE